MVIRRPDRQEENFILSIFSPRPSVSVSRKSEIVMRPAGPPEDAGVPAGDAAPATSSSGPQPSMQVCAAALQKESTLSAAFSVQMANPEYVLRLRPTSGQKYRIVYDVVRINMLCTTSGNAEQELLVDSVWGLGVRQRVGMVCQRLGWRESDKEPRSSLASSIPRFIIFLTT